jgi:hypothetical protein
MPVIDIKSIRDSYDRLVEAVEGYNKRSDYALWLQVIKKESRYLLRRVFAFCWKMARRKK